MEKSLTFLHGIPKDITVGKVPFHMVFLCRSCFPVLIWVWIYRFWNTLTMTILVHSGLIETFLFSNCFTYILSRSFRFNLNWIRFVFLPNKIELIGSIEFDWFDWVRLSNSRFRLIELTEKVQFDYVRLPNQSNNNPTDWVRLSLIDFWFGFVRLATRDVFIGYSCKVSAHYKQALSLSQQSFCNFKR